MKIIAGLSPDYIIRNQKTGDDYSKIELLIDSGINEFFVGYVPNYWYENFGFEISPNGRQSAQAQIQSKESLKGIVDYIHLKGCEVFVTLNANSFNDQVWKKVINIINDVIEVGVDGLIVSDLGIMDYLKSINYKGKINISTIFNTYNSEIIKFLIKNYNINRIVLPREMTLREIGKLCKNFPQVNFEVFLNGDKCIWNNGSCFTEHNTKNNPHSYCQYIEKIYIPKKRVNYNFKEIIKSKNNTLINNELNNTPEGTLEDIGNKLLMGILNEKEIIYYYNFFKNKLITVYDNSISPERTYNKNIIKYINGLKINLNKIKDNDMFNEISLYIKEKEEKINYGINFYNNKINTEGIEYIKKVDTLEWNRNGVKFIDYFKKFPNLVALKVPSRGKDIHHILEYMFSNNKNSLKNYLSNNLLDEKKDNSNYKFYYYNPLENTFI